MPPRRSRASRPGLSPEGRSPEGPGALDWLRLLGIQAYGHLGVTRREGILGQRVEADVELALRAVAGARPDRLSAVVDYEAVERFVRSRIERSRRRLLETLAEDLARSLLREFRVPSVRIRLRKLHVPVSGFSGTPEVWIERSRA